MAELAGEVLGEGRESSIAVNHAIIVHQKSALEKSNPLSGLVLMQIS
jgi:hypothetical protein